MVWSRRHIMGAGLAALAGAIMTKPALAAAPLMIPEGGGPLPAPWLQAERVPLWPMSVSGAGFTPRPRRPDWPQTFLSNIAEPELRLFRPARPLGKALLVIPGGAYNFVSIRNEGVDVARVFNAAGYHVYVLAYRLPGEGWADRADVPLRDAQRAMRVIRSRAAQDRVSDQDIAVIGFSAGGHLAASLLTGFDERIGAPVDGVDRIDARPQAGILVYPVISMAAPFTHAWSAQTLLGNAPEPALIERRSPAAHVTGRTPPVFLVHALDDDAVPYQNSMIMADALAKAGRPPEIHLFAEGRHGFGIGPSNGPAGEWPVLAQKWLLRL